MSCGRAWPGGFDGKRKSFRTTRTSFWSKGLRKNPFPDSGGIRERGNFFGILALKKASSHANQLRSRMKFLIKNLPPK
jgi:hypothetical protein